MDPIASLRHRYKWFRGECPPSQQRLFDRLLDAAQPAVGAIQAQVDADLDRAVFLMMLIAAIVELEGDLARLQQRVAVLDTARGRPLVPTG